MNLVKHLPYTSLGNYKIERFKIIDWYSKFVNLPIFFHRKMLKIVLKMIYFYVIDTYIPLQFFFNFTIISNEPFPTTPHFLLKKILTKINETPQVT